MTREIFHKAQFSYKDAEHTIVNGRKTVRFKFIKVHKLFTATKCWKESDSHFVDIGMKNPIHEA